MQQEFRYSYSLDNNDDMAAISFDNFNLILNHFMLKLAVPTGDTFSPTDRE